MGHLGQRNGLEAPRTRPQCCEELILNCQVLGVWGLLLGALGGVLAVLVQVVGGEGGVSGFAFGVGRAGLGAWGYGGFRCLRAWRTQGFRVQALRLMGFGGARVSRVWWFKV